MKIGLIIFTVIPYAFVSVIKQMEAAQVMIFLIFFLYRDFFLGSGECKDCGEQD